jgi:hypothetical protein
VGVPRNWVFPATQGPKTGGPKKELSQTQAPTQAYKAAGQVRSGQFTLGAGLHSHSSGLLYSRLRLKHRVLRSEDRSAILVRSFFADDYVASFKGQDDWTNIAGGLADAGSPHGDLAPHVAAIPSA